MSSQQDVQVFNWHYTELDDQNLEVRGRKFFFVIVLFAIVLLVTLLFFFARWICRYRDHLPTTYHSSQVLHESPPPPQGLDLASIKKLPIILHQAPSDSDCALEETECCICLSAFEDGEKLKVLPGCNHCFHCECVDNWLINRSSCPLCRSSLKLDSSFPHILIEEPPIRIDLQF